MATLFLSPTGHCSPRWKAAFPDLELERELRRCEERDVDGLCWVDVDGFSPAGASVSAGAIAADPTEASAGSSAGARSEDSAADAVRRLVAAGWQVVALSTTPSQQQAFDILSLGARGYCHAEAVPEQLVEVAQVVAAGGFWMPPALVQRLVKAASRIEVEPDPAAAAALETLSDREQQVANLIGRGFNNREIAEALNVSERTVKAHLTSTFDKLAIRDRVQLALLVNRLPVH